MEAQWYCENENDDFILNKCLAQKPPGLFTLLANFVLNWVNPRILATSVLFVILVLPLIQLTRVPTPQWREAKQRYRFTKLQLLNFLHRLTFPLMLDVALYAVFRQSRPCRCGTNGQLTHVGSIYGMPSGDAMAAGILGAYIWDAAPFHPIAARIFAAILVPMVAMERVALGLHSIAQVIVGSSLGILLHIYSRNMPQFMVFVDCLVQTALGFITLSIDPNLVYDHNDSNNLMVWFIWGLSFEVFVVLMIGQHYFNKRDVRKLLLPAAYLEQQQQFRSALASDEVRSTSAMNDSNASYDFEELKTTLNKVDAWVKPSEILRIPDTWFAMVSFSLMNVVNFASYIVQQYDLLVRTRPT